MQIVTIFDPAITTSDTFVVPQSSANGKMVVYNESNISLTFMFQNGNTAYVPAWTAVLFHGPFGNVNVTWQQQTILSGGGQAPLTQVVIETYDCNESLPGTYPAALVRQTNIGNSLNVSTSVTSLANDGNPTGTSIVEATVAGDASSAVTLSNNGVMTLGTTTNTGSLSIKGAGAGNALAITQGKTSLDNGAILTDGSGNILWHGQLGTASAGDRIDASTGNDTYIKCLAAGNINFQTPGGSTVAQILSSNGQLTLVHSLTLPVGSIGQLSRFTGTGNATVATGVTNPTTISFDPCTTSGSTQTIGGTIATSSVVTTGAGLAWSATAWHL